MAALLLVSVSGGTHAQLARPSGDPLAIDMSRDPILQLRRTTGSEQTFLGQIQGAVLRHPSLAEAYAGEREAKAARVQARAARFSTADLSLSTNQSIVRGFSNDIDTIVERSRAQGRTDAVLTIQQPILDFGATGARIEAAGARLRAASADTDDAASTAALKAIAAWYDVFGYRALVRLGTSFVDSQKRIRSDVEQRVAQGYSAEGDVARADSYIASADTRTARYRRSLANAEARYAQMMGAPAPAQIDRAPIVGPRIVSADIAADGASKAPAIVSAQAMAEAARDDARAARADRLPTVAAAVDAGRYGVFETKRDYAVSGRLTLRARLSGGINARADQFSARAEAAEARAARTREEAMRDASIAWSDVAALETQLDSLEANYTASRRSRDVLAERFRVSRGTLFDLLAAEDAYFETAASYVETLTELDAARYVLLARSGKLLSALSIAPGDPKEMP